MSGHLRATDFELRPVSNTVATDLVTTHHYAKGGPNTGVFRHGLFRLVDNELCGVAWWLPPTRVAAEAVAGEDWRGVLSLTRLVVVPGMPTNSASFLLGRSIRLIRQDGRWSHLVTWADEGQGHTGAIYKATNWVYQGARPGDPVYRDPTTGRQVSRKAGRRSRTHAEMIELGYVTTGRTRKHRFAIHLNQNGIPT